MAASNKGRTKSAGRSASWNGSAQKNRPKTSVKNTKTSKKTRNQASEKSSGILNDILLLMALALAVLLFISLIGFGGLVGGAVRSFLFGTSGTMACILPIALFILIAFMISNRLNRRIFKKLLAGILLFAALCGLFQSVTDGYEASLSFMDYYDRSALYHSGGGLIGGTVFHLLASAFGIIGANVILILLLMIALVLLTQRSFFGFLARIGRRIGAWISDGKDRYDERKPERELKREIHNREQTKRREMKRAVRMKELEARLSAQDEEDWNAEEEEELALASGRKGKTTSGSSVRPGARKKPEKLPAFLEGTWLKEEKNGQLRLDEKSLDPKEASSKTDSSASSAKQKSGPKPGSSPVVNLKFQEETFSEVPYDDHGMDHFEEFDSEAALYGEEAMHDEKNDTVMNADGSGTASEAQPEQKRSPQKNPKSSKEEIAEGIESVKQEISAKDAAPQKEYHFPPTRLLERGSGKNRGDSAAYLKETAQKLQDTLYNFGVNATVTDVSCGPSVTRFELQPEMGVKVSRIVGLADDIQLNLATSDIRIEAPIPGKAAVGIEVPNKENTLVKLRDILESDEFKYAQSKISFAVGKDIGGKPVVADIAKMPHVLIAGATGSGKSVCINTLIVSILYKAAPEEVKLIMIDPKVVELSVYNGIPHLLIPVVTDPKKAAGALNWAVTEMTSRYNTFAEYHVRNLQEYRRKVKTMETAEGEEKPPLLPQIVIIVDELADLMMVAPGEVEDAIVRLSQLARAAGIHLVIATQRPSVNVITGLIKANMPSRIAFAVTSGVDSRTILDMNGAEKLLGKGDMLFYPQGYSKPARLQGSYISDDEVSAVVGYLTKKNPDIAYDSSIEQQVNSSGSASAFSGDEERDVYFEEAGKFLIEKEKATIGMLQRMFKIGFNRAARIMDQLSDAGVVGPEEGTKPRKILMTEEEFQALLDN